MSDFRRAQKTSYTPLRKPLPPNDFQDGLGDATPGATAAIVNPDPTVQVINSISQPGQDQGPPFFTGRLRNDIAAVKKLIGDSDDIVFREIQVRGKVARAAIIYVDGLVDISLLGDQILKAIFQHLPGGKTAPKECESGNLPKRIPGNGLEDQSGSTSEAESLLTINQLPGAKSTDASSDQTTLSTDPTKSSLLSHTRAAALLRVLKEEVLYTGEIKEVSGVYRGVELVLSGETLLLLDGSSISLSLGIRGWESRNVEEPASESVIRGPREGFTETLRTNTALLRRRSRDHNLKIRSLKVGVRSRTDCALAYIDGIVNKDLLAEVQRRLARITLDQILDSGYVEQLIEDSRFSPFPQIQYTERPDKVMGCLNEGRVAILVDGAPQALLVPATFSQFFQSPEDYTERWLISSFTRALRIAASYLATFTPGLYVALVSFNPGLIPTPLALSIAATREAVPFPIFLEVLILEVAFELFREAGLRLPRPIGQTVGIVGGLIIGEAAVRARLASPITVIIVATTAIASFVIPSYNMAIAFRLIRFPVLLAGGALGLYGIVLSFIVVNTHMVIMKSFGMVYLASFVPYRWSDWKDVIYRVPWLAMERRPIILKTEDIFRQSPRGGKKGRA